MLKRLANFAGGIAREPPFRLAARMFVKHLPLSVPVKSAWDVVARPQYLAGLVHAAREARSAGVKAICAIEFGVAGGAGLVELQRYAADVGQHYGLRIDVVGFDAGSGLPDFCGDHRDHPDLWAPGDYPMNESALRAKLRPETRLIIGNVSATIANFVATEQAAPVGFISFDLDLYSSTVAAFGIFTHEKRNLLRRVTVYFDDVHTAIYHRAAGEYLAISEFNAGNHGVFIDNWHNVKVDRPFPEAFWTNKMYIAHHLDAITRAGRAARPAQVLPLHP
jgi:hypothetical protein